jgi:hypothetical protein
MVTAERQPCFHAFRAERFFPALVLGPLDLVHGCQRWISVACRARRTEFQPFAIVALQ